MIKITLNVELTDDDIEHFIISNDQYDLTKEEVERVITTFLKEEVGTVNGLLMLIENIDLFNY